MSTLRQHNVAKVLVKGTEIGYIVEWGRLTYNSYGNSNNWTCFQFIPLEENEMEYQFVNLSEKGELQNDLAIFNNEEPKVSYRLGLRDGEYIKLALVNVDDMEYVPFHLVIAEWNANVLQDISGHIDLRWGREDVPIDNVGLYVDDTMVATMYRRGLEEFAVIVDDNKVTRYQDFHLGLVKKYIEKYREEQTQGDEEAPSEETRPKRVRKVKPQE